MNEDQDYNETPQSEAVDKEKRDPNGGPGGAAAPHDVPASNNEGIGEAVMNAVKASTSSPKARKKTIDDAQDDKINELIRDLQRTRADFENFRRQTEVQKEQYGNAVKFATVKKILTLLDDIDRAIAANPDTLGPLKKSFEKTTKELGLSKIPAQPGAAFNPDLHDAVMVDGDGEEEVIGETLRPGYYYDGVVIRPAMVKVTKQ